LNSIPFTLESDSKAKLYFQLYKKIIESIQKGVFPVGKKLPSVRQLAEGLKISRNTVNTAYKMLTNEGYVTSHAKSGYVVNECSSFIVDADLIKTDNEQHTEEASEIPTVDSVIKEREGTAIQKIPLPEGFVQSSELPLPPLPPKDIDLFGEKKERREIAIELYEKRHISCTSGQVILSDSLQNLLVQAIQILSPKQEKEIHVGKGLLKLAEAAAQGKLTKTNSPAFSYTVAFSEKAAELFTQIASKNDIEVKEFSNSENLAISFPVEDAEVKVAVIVPIYDGSITEEYESLLEWTEKTSDRYLIEYDTGDSKEEDSLFSDVNNENIVYIAKQQNTSGSTDVFMVVPPKLVKIFRNGLSKSTN
jgi:DNA-binding transcriptional regulator YhcF (GntR family)